MTKVKSLVDGIGNETLTEKYYDDWALSYDQTLKKWNYKAPIKAVNIMSLLKENINSNLDLACGTGMFATTLKKKYPNITIDGCDISSQSLKVAKKKKLYRKLIKQSFEKKINITKKYDSVSMIVSMTYCAKPKTLFSLIFNCSANSEECTFLVLIKIFIICPLFCRFEFSKGSFFIIFSLIYFMHLFSKGQISHFGFLFVQILDPKSITA